MLSPPGNFIVPTSLPVLIIVLIEQREHRNCHSIRMQSWNSDRTLVCEYPFASPTVACYKPPRGMQTEDTIPHPTSERSFAADIKLYYDLQVAQPAPAPLLIAL